MQDRESDELPEGVDLPPDAVAAGLTCELNVTSLQDIVNNLLDKAPEADAAGV